MFINLISFTTSACYEKIVDNMLLVFILAQPPPFWCRPILPRPNLSPPNLVVPPTHNGLWLEEESLWCASLSRVRLADLQGHGSRHCRAIERNHSTGGKYIASQVAPDIAVPQVPNISHCSIGSFLPKFSFTSDQIDNRGEGEMAPPASGYKGGATAWLKTGGTRRDEILL